MPVTQPIIVPLHWRDGRLVPPADFQPSRAVPAAKLTVLHTNDFHSSIDGRPQGEGVRGGLARIAATIRAAKESGPTLVVDAGDSVFGGGTWWNALGAGPTARLLGAAGYQLAAIGNHDLEHGLDGLRELLTGGYRLVGANLEFDDRELAEAIAPAYLVDLPGMLVGVTGVTTPTTTQLVPRSMLRGLRIVDPLDSLRRVVEELDPMVDTIIVLSHMGFNHGAPSDQHLAPQLSGSNVSVVLGGHTHDALDPAPVIDGIVTCNAGSYGANVNEVTLERVGDLSVQVRTRLIAQDTSVADDEGLLLARDREAAAFDVLHQDMRAMPPLLVAAHRAMPSGPDKDREWALLRQAIETSGRAATDAVLLVPYLYLLGHLPERGWVSRAEVLTAYPNIEQLLEVELQGSGLKQLLALQGSLIFYEAALPLWLSDGQEVRPGQIDDEGIYRAVTSQLVAEGGLEWAIAPGLIKAAHALDASCADFVWAYLDGAGPRVRTGELVGTGAAA